MAVASTAEILRLRTALRDLVALSPISAAWVGREPPDIAAGLADVLVGSLHLDFAFVRLCDPTGVAAVEVTRGSAWKAFPEWLEHHLAMVGRFSRKEIIPDVGGGAGPCHGIVIPVGVNAEGGLVAAACDRTDFPTEIDQLLLSVAANHAVTAFQNSRLIHERRIAEQALRESEQELRQARDELEAKVAERTTELRQSEARLEEAQRFAHVGYWVRDLETDRITWSDETYRIFGLEPQERTLEFAWLHELIHPEDRQIIARAAAEVLGGGGRYDMEYRIVRPGGEIRTVHSQGKVVRDESGRPRRVFGTIQDITERRRGESLFRESEQRFRAIFNEAGTGIALLDLVSGGPIENNRALQIMLGCSRDELSRVEIYNELTCEEDREADAILFRELCNGKRETLRQEKHFILRDGRSVWANVIFTLLRDTEGSPKYVIAIHEDITERKRAEEALQKAQAELAHVSRLTTMGELTSSIAHEVNQPLTALVTSSNACLRWLATQPPNLDEARECLRRIVRDGNRASEVITRIRSLVRKSSPAKELLDLGEMIQEVLAIINAEARRQRVLVRTELAAGLPPVRGDRVQLQQVVLNLIINGIEAMRPVTDRPRSLLVRTERDESGRVMVSVEDTGTGIDPQNVDRLFDAFYTTKTEGMGMGLSISRSIIEAHGGRLWASANSQHGATLQFALPANGTNHHN